MNKVFSFKNNNNIRIGVSFYSDKDSKTSLENVKLIVVLVGYQLVSYLPTLWTRKTQKPEIDTNKNKISLKDEAKLRKNNEVTASDIGKM